MLTLALPILFAVLIWWLSTGLILWVGSHSGLSKQACMVGASVLAVMAFLLLFLTRGAETVMAVYTSFLAVIVIWGWHELAFLLGLVTGSRKQACPEGVTGLARFSMAVEVVIFHELALLATGMIIAFITLGADNHMAVMTFLILWLMRISAKLNLYLGAPNINTDMMPDHLSYMKSYFQRGAISPFFALAITLGTLTFGYFAKETWQATGAREATEAALLATLIALAVIEHWFFVFPFNETRMWSLFSRARKKLTSTKHMTNTDPRSTARNKAVQM